MRELETAVLMRDVPEHGLVRGDIGTVVHRYEGGAAYEVEFMLGEGATTVAVLTLEEKEVRPVEPHEILHVRTLDTV